MGFSDDCIEAAGPVWERWLHHPWTEALFSGELSDERFRYWLIQDLPYLGQRITDPVHPKVPAHVPFVELSHEYAVRADTTRVELETNRDLGDFAKTRWAARPMREAAINFWLRAAHEGSFGEFCAAIFVCYSFAGTFGSRYAAERPDNLPHLQRLWVEQWVDPYFVRLYECIRDGLDEAGASATEAEREEMRWLMLRGTQWQIGTFDVAWNLTDPWPGEGEESGVLADGPWMRGG